MLLEYGQFVLIITTVILKNHLCLIRKTAENKVNFQVRVFFPEICEKSCTVKELYMVFSETIHPLNRIVTNSFEPPNLHFYR